MPPKKKKNKDKSSKQIQNESVSKDNSKKVNSHEKIGKENKSECNLHKYTKYNPDIANIHEHFAKHFQKGDDDYHYTCISCKNNRMPNWSGFYDHLSLHLQTDKHKIAVYKDQEEIPEALEALDEFRVKKKKVKVVKKEIIDSLRIDATGFLLENELPFALAPKLTHFVQEILKDYGEQAIKQFSLSNVLSSQIAKNAICKTYKEQIFNDLQYSLFSLTFDVSSDFYGPSYLCVHVRYIKQEKIITRLLPLEEIKGSSTGESLFCIFESIFNNAKGLLSRNLVGVSTDQGSNMISKHDKGLTNRIIAKYPQTFRTIDLCHSFHNICKYSLKKLPKEPLTLIKNICSHFGGSSLRRSNFRKIQEDFGEDEFIEALNVLRYVSHRWSSLLSSTKRILLLWENLEIYFDKYEDRDVSSIMNSKNYLYLELLAILLERLNSSIKYFEKDDHEFASIMPKLRETLVLTAKFVIKEEIQLGKDNKAFFETILALQWNKREQLEPNLKDIPSFKEHFLNKYSDMKNYSLTHGTDFEDLFPIAKEFLIEAIFQLKERIPYCNKVLNSCDVIKLENFDETKWKVLAQQFTNIITRDNSDIFINELDSLAYNFETLRLAALNSSQNFIAFWLCKKEEFPFISKLAQACLTLSYSTVSIERTFSILRDIRTPKRNKLCTESVEACLLIHHESKDNSFQATKEMLNNYKNRQKLYTGISSLYPGIVICRN